MSTTIEGAVAPPEPMAEARRLQPGDYFRLRSVGDVRWSPDGRAIAYTVHGNDPAQAGEPALYVRSVLDGLDLRVGGAAVGASAPEWSPDGEWIAFVAAGPDGSELKIVRRDGSETRLIAPLGSTNHPLPNVGKGAAWSPDGGAIAFVSATPGPAGEDPGSDPMVITRYLYKPHALERRTRFNDNRRLHIFVATLAGGDVRQLTAGPHHEHSIDWSPSGDEILFVSNREPDEDRFFNYDLFAVHPGDGRIRRLTATESAEYRPHWSPDGRAIACQATRRGLTNLETTMEHYHVWLMDADGGHRRELAASVDNRQGEPGWSHDGQFVYFPVHHRGTVRLCRIPSTGGDVEVVVAPDGLVGSWSVNADGAIACAMSTPHDVAQLYLIRPGEPPEQLTDLNADVLGGVPLAPVSSFEFVSNDHVHEVEAFLTRPTAAVDDAPVPLVVVIHGGPHTQQGPAFNFDNQVYAANGLATLMVNYRGSVGYGQRFSDAVFRDQNGDDAQDVLYGLSAAVRRHLWIDRDRLGIEGLSYGGQLTAWLITQTHVFKAAIAMAAVVNLVSHNYTAYYNQYEQMEWGLCPHQGDMMDVLWGRSPLKHVSKARTPTMLIHGENDCDVPIGEAEQFYIALRDIGADAVLVRYPREAHVLKEPAHVVDRLVRSMSWYEHWFDRGAGRSGR